MEDGDILPHGMEHLDLGHDTLKLALSEGSEDPHAGLIEWLKAISLEALAALEIVPIIPGVNDIMIDEVASNEADQDDMGEEEATRTLVGVGKKPTKKKIRVSRGLRGAAEIALAAKQALENPAVRVKEGPDADKYTRECFLRPVLLPSEVEYFKARQSKRMVLELAQSVARDESKSRWTPLINLPGIDPTIEENRIAAIELMVEQARTLAKTLLQRKGHNIPGQVVRHENWTKKFAVKKPPALPSAPISAQPLSAPSSAPLPLSAHSNRKRKPKGSSSDLADLKKQSQFERLHPARRDAASIAVGQLMASVQAGSLVTNDVPLNRLMGPFLQIELQIAPHFQAWTILMISWVPALVFATMMISWIPTLVCATMMISWVPALVCATMIMSMISCFPSLFLSQQHHLPRVHRHHRQHRRHHQLFQLL